MIKDNIETGEEHVPQIRPEFLTERTKAARLRYVEAWNEWRYRPTFSTAVDRDEARRNFYAEIGRQACNKVDDR